MEDRSPEGSQNRNTFSHIIGIGASAGGMEALHQLFDHFAPNTGFSFVVVQHLSPDHKSLLSELLAKHTRMRVIEAADDMLVRPNCVYVIPSKKLITIQRRRLRLMDKASTRGPNDAIDVFFKALAQDQKEMSVGIILSGTGTDGTKGLQAIKEAGGIAIVQQPDTAAFDGMPASAVDGVDADIVAPPEHIGTELLQMLNEPPVLSSLKSLKKDDEALIEEILELMRHSTRHDFSHYKRPTLVRRLSKRMTELNIQKLGQYRDYIAKNELELKRLSQDFLINVTAFFRDPEAFETLRLHVLPSIFLNRKPGEPVKVWVVACSTGEEAYSVAILFLEHIRQMEENPIELKVFATDIDNEALEIASRGVYSKVIESNVPAPFLSRYFIREDKCFRVTPDLRKVVVFATHDVIKEPPFSRLDLVTCRNMFIYLNHPLQMAALKKFQFALKVNSFLMLGPSENIGILKDSTEEIHRKWKIYRIKNKSRIDVSTMLSPLGKSVLHQSVHRKKPELHLSDVLRDTLLDDRKMAMILIDREFNVKQAIGSYKDFVQLPDSSLEFNILKLVNAEMAISLGVLIRKAMAENCKATMRNVALHQHQATRSVNLIVKPYLEASEAHQPFLSIIIEENTHHDDRPAPSLTSSHDVNGEHVASLEKELMETRQDLQAIIEEMEAVNEELQSSNEEMISTNEELQSTNEELQSLNEELHTVSAEHQLKIKELFELNDDLNNYFNNSDIGQILIDSDRLIRKFSPAIKKIINLIDSDVGRSLFDITTNLKDLNFADQVDKVISAGNAMEEEVQSVSDDYYLMRIAPYVRRDHTTDGVVVNFIDISQSKRLNSIIEGVFKSSPNGITAKKAIRDEKNNIVDFEYVAMNASAEKMIQTSHESLVGKRLLETLSESERKKHFDIYKNVVETGRTTKIEYYHEGAGKWYETTIVKMLDGVVATRVDITDRKRSADLIARNYEDLKLATEKLSESNMQLERSNFDLMQFASVASHDLKEPLRKIQAFGNILLSRIKAKLSDSELNYFSKIILASNRMQALIDDVLTLSKLSNGSHMRVLTDLNVVVKQIAEDLEITIKEKNAVLKIASLPTIEAVPGQMHQVFQNLISNALKFTNKEQPVITVEQLPIMPQHAIQFGVKPDQFAYVVVRDNGIGFENEYKEKIFGIFQRLHGRNFEGTGIGLAIARKIMENHGGLIFADGELNRGATFHIYFPLKAESELFEKKATLVDAN